MSLKLDLSDLSNGIDQASHALVELSSGVVTHMKSGKPVDWQKHPEKIREALVEVEKLRKALERLNSLERDGD